MYPSFLAKFAIQFGIFAYGGILGVLVKNSLNLISFPSIPLNFGRNEKFKILREYRRISVPSYPFYSFSFKLPNKRMDFSFLSLKLPNKGREEYSKIILFIFLFHPPKQWLNQNVIIN